MFFFLFFSVYAGSLFAAIPPTVEEQKLARLVEQVQQHGIDQLQPHQQVQWTQLQQQTAQQRAQRLLQADALFAEGETLQGCQRYEYTLDTMDKLVAPPTQRLNVAVRYAYQLIENRLWQQFTQLTQRPLPWKEAPQTDALFQALQGAAHLAQGHTTHATELFQKAFSQASEEGQGGLALVIVRYCQHEKAYTLAQQWLKEGLGKMRAEHYLEGILRLIQIYRLREKWTLAQKKLTQIRATSLTQTWQQQFLQEQLKLWVAMQKQDAIVDWARKHRITPALWPLVIENACRLADRAATPQLFLTALFQKAYTVEHTATSSAAVLRLLLHPRFPAPSEPERVLYPSERALLLLEWVKHVGALWHKTDYAPCIEWIKGLNGQKHQLDRYPDWKGIAWWLAQEAQLQHLSEKQLWQTVTETMQQPSPKLWSSEEAQQFWQGSVLPLLYQTLFPIAQVATLEKMYQRAKEQGWHQLADASHFQWLKKQPQPDWQVWKRELQQRTDPQARLYLARIYALEEQPKKSIELLTEGDPHPQHLSDALSLAITHQWWERAEALRGQILKLFPWSDQARAVEIEGIAQGCTTLRQCEEQVRYWDHLHNRPTIHITIAALRFVLSHKEEDCTTLVQLLQQNPLQKESLEYRTVQRYVHQALLIVLWQSSPQFALFEDRHVTTWLVDSPINPLFAVPYWQSLAKADPPRAQSFLETLLRGAPHLQTSAAICQGIQRQERQQWDAAIHSLQKALKSTHLPAQRAMLYDRLITCYTAMGQQEQVRALVTAMVMEDWEPPLHQQALALYKKVSHA